MQEVGDSWLPRAEPEVVDPQEAWLQCLGELAVQYVVLGQSQDRELVRTLRAQPEWSVLFEGDGAVIFGHSSTRAKGNIR